MNTVRVRVRVIRDTLSGSCSDKAKRQCGRRLGRNLAALIEVTANGRITLKVNMGMNKSNRRSYSDKQQDNQMNTSPLHGPWVYKSCDEVEGTFQV